jgi:hypothetical protein
MSRGQLPEPLAPAVAAVAPDAHCNELVRARMSAPLANSHWLPRT